MRRFVLLVLLQISLSVVAYASDDSNVNCDNVLGKTLSAAAQSYIKVIQHYSQQMSGAASKTVVDKILNSKEIINPFSGGIDSFSILLSSAVEKIKPKIQLFEWPRVQDAVRVLGEVHKAQQVDRSHKEEETSWLKEVTHIGTKESSGAGLDRTEMHIEVVSGRLLSVQWTDGRIFVGEFKDGVGWTTIADISKISAWKDATFSWQVVKGKIYLAFLPGHLVHAKIYDGSDRRINYLSVFELTSSNELVFKSRAETVFTNREQPIWFVAQDKAFILAGGHITDWQLFEFQDEELSYVSNLDIVKDNAFGPVTWLQNTKRLLVAVREENDLVVKGLIGHQIVEIAKIANESDITHLHLQEAGGRVFLSAIQRQDAFKGGVSFLYEIKSEMIEFVAQLEFPKRVGREKPVVYIENNKIYTIHDSEMALFHHEIAADKSTRLVENLPVPRNLTSPVGSFAIGHRRFVFFGTFADRQYLYEIINGAFVFLHEALGGRQEKPFTSFVVGDNVHLAYPFKEKVRSESYQYQKQIKK